MQPIYIGIKGTVVALNEQTGVEVWRTDLKGVSFVNLARTRDYILAATRGEVFCLRPSDGAIVWHNPLKGLGQGLVTLLCAGTNNSTAVAEQQIQEEAAASAAASATVATCATC